MPPHSTCICVRGLHSGQRRPGLRVFEHGDGVRVGGELGGVVIHVFQREQHVRLTEPSPSVGGLDQQVVNSLLLAVQGG